MSESVLITLIAGILAALGSFVGNMAITAKKARTEAIKDAEREQAQKDQRTMILEEQKEIKKRLDQHNGYAEKFANSETAMTAIQKDIEYMKKDISEIKERSK